ncbi:acetolactate synthase small subunit [Flavobacterium sp. HJSW_4]|uniref:acetolactate synthase small subunit n=1 Tax=Flavobacterium sp. HJSW_4 TaxID=3344660 RepID=UPI0035F44B1F
MEHDYTLTIYSESQFHLLNKLSSMFIRKGIKVLSLNMSESEIEKIYRITIVVNERKDNVINLAAQIEKIIEVYKCYYSHDDEIIYRQTALIKISTAALMSEKKIEKLLEDNELRISEIRSDYTILQATGQVEDINYLVEELTPLGLTEFVKGPRITLISSCPGFSIEL